MAESFRNWFRSYRSMSEVRLRLICFPHAGGTAGFYRTWQSRLPLDVQLLAVQYPGREDRLGEPLVDDMNRMADLIAYTLTPILNRPVALFGHSMGAAVAYEVARRIEDRLRHVLVRLIVSGCPAPRYQQAGTKHLLPDEELWEDLCRLGGTTKQVLDDLDLRRLLLPIVRSDYRVDETYRPYPGAMLECPVLACVSDHDTEVSIDEARGWEEITHGEFTCRLFSGDHFYLVPRQAELLGEITQCLNSTRTAQPSVVLQRLQGDTT